MTDDDKRLLRIAYDEAKAGFDEGGCPIGSVLARNGEVVSRGRNQRVQGGDPIGPWRNGRAAQGRSAKDLSRHGALYLAQSLHDVFRHDRTIRHPARCNWGHNKFRRQ